MKTLARDEFFHDPGIPLAIAHSGRGADYPPHTHDFSEIVVIRQGRGTHTLNDQEYPIRAGDVFVIQGKQVHSYSGSTDVELTNLLFDRSRLRLPEDDLATLPGYHALFTLEPHYRPQHRFDSCLHLDSIDLRHVEGILDALELELHEQRPARLTATLAHFLQLIVFLSRAYDGTRNAASRKVLRLAEAVSLMEAEYMEKLSIDMLAERAHMARSTFYRAFEAAYGQPPLEYLQTLRLRHATGLLRDTGLSLTAIALQTGFGDSNYFSRVFRQKTGETPSAYRKRFRVE